MVYPPGNYHILALEEENHRLKLLAFRGYVTFTEGRCF